MTLRLVPDLNAPSPTDAPVEDPTPAGSDPGEPSPAARLGGVSHDVTEALDHKPDAAIEALASSLFDSANDAPTPAEVEAAERRVEMLLGYHDDLTSAMVMTLTGGWTAPQTPSLSHWEAQFSCERYDVAGLALAQSWPVAHMSLTVVNPVAGDPLTDLRFHDDDAGELGEALFADNGERTIAFDAVADDDYRPVLLINTYEVEDGWRGTDLTPVLALRALKAFAHLGIDAAALCAAPIAEDMTVTERERVADRISAMWAKTGFDRLDTPVTDGLDPLVMAAPLDGHALDETLHLLVGTDEMLIAGAAL